MLKRGILLGILLFAFLAPAQEQEEKAPFYVLNALPQRTIAFLGTHSIQKTKTASTTTSLGKILRDPKMQSFVNSMKGLVNQNTTDATKVLQENIGLSIDELLETPVGEIIVAMIDFNVFQGRPSILVSLQLFDQTDKAISLFEPIRTNSYTTRDYKGYTLYQGTKNKMVNLVNIRGTLVFATDRWLLQEMINTESGRGRPLVHQTEFQSLGNHLFTNDETVVFGAYLNTMRLYQMSSLLMPVEVFKIAKSLSLDKFRALGVSSSIDQEGRSRTRAFLHTGSEGKGLASLFRVKPASINKFATLTPADASSFACLRVGLQGFMNRVETILEEVDPDGKMRLLQQYEGLLQLAQQKTGIDIRGLAKAFGSEVSSFHRYSGGLLPEKISIIPLQDKQAAAKFFQQCTKLLRLQTKERTYLGQKIFYFSSPLGKFGNNPFEKMAQLEGLKQIRLALTYGMSGIAYMVDGDNLLVGSSVHSLMDYIDWKNSSQPALSGQKSFIHAAYTYNKSFFFVYGDLRCEAASLWSTLLFALRAGEGHIRDAGIPLDTALLPSGKQIGEYFGLFQIATTSKGDGLHFEMNNSCNPFVFLGHSLPMILPLIIQAQLDMLKKAQEAICRNQLMQMSHIYYMLQLDYGCYPPADSVCSLSVLFKAKLADYPGLLNSPRSGRKTTLKEILADNGSNFDYEATSLQYSFQVEDINSQPFIWTKKGVHPGFRHVLFFNGSVEKIEEEDFEEMMKRQQELMETYKEEMAEHRRQALEAYDSFYPTETKK